MSWFSIQQIQLDTYAISEEQHWEETHCYLLLGSKFNVLIDSGLGVASIRDVVKSIDAKETIVVATHAHWDHIGGHHEFDSFYVHEAEVGWLQDKFPLPLSLVKEQLLKQPNGLADSFIIDDYTTFKGQPTRILKDGDIIDLGNRCLQVLHTPGHAPGHMCFYESERKTLFGGDLLYYGTLYANYPSTNPKDYLASLAKLQEIDIEYLWPAHHEMYVEKELVKTVYKAFLKLQSDNLLHHGAGIFTFENFTIHI